MKWARLLKWSLLHSNLTSSDATGRVVILTCDMAMVLRVIISMALYYLYHLHKVKQHLTCAWMDDHSVTAITRANSARYPFVGLVFDEYSNTLLCLEMSQVKFGGGAASGPSKYKYIRNSELSHFKSASI